MNRRSLLKTTALLPVAAIAGCASFSTNFQKGLQVAQTLADGMAGALSQLGQLGIAGLTPQIAAEFGVYVGDLKQLAAKLQTALTEAQAQGVVQQIEAAVNAAIGVLAGLPLPAPISTILQAAAVALPMLEQLFNMVVPVQTKARAGAAGMSDEDALKVLRQAALKAR